MAVLCFALHIFVQITVSLVGFVGLARADIEDGLLYSLVITCEILLVETRGKAAGVIDVCMTSLQLAQRPWRHIVIGVPDGRIHDSMR